VVQVAIGPSLPIRARKAMSAMKVGADSSDCPSTVHSKVRRSHAVKRRLLSLCTGEGVTVSRGAHGEL
jgi:hypothetical protein